MNRRSMIKRTALGASAALIAASEGHSEEQNMAAQKSPTPVVNARDYANKPIPLNVKADAPLAFTTQSQKWEYTFVEMHNLETLNIRGSNGWEAVAIESGRVLLKRPL
jgi:hypothetical protein